MDKKKSKVGIFLVANTSWYLLNFRLPLLEELLAQGYRVFAVSPIDSYAERFQEYDIKHIDFKMTRSGINPLEDILLILKFINIYTRYRPDIVQHFTIKPVIYGSIAARIARVKYIYNMIPGLGYVFTGKSFKKFWVRKIAQFLYRRSLLFSQHVYFQNREDRDYFVKQKIVDLEKTSVVPGTGVDIHLFSPKPLIKKNGITFILAARMLWDKGIKEFVEAAYCLKKKYENVHFWLLGPVDLQNPRGITPEQLRAWNNDGVVKYLGMTDDVKSYLDKANVIVLPSFYREGIPLSLLEGAAMGMPIIATDSTGCREVVEDGTNGFLIPIKDSEALATAMERFISNPRLIVRMGAESRKIAVAKFDSRKVVKEILNYYPFLVSASLVLILTYLSYLS